MKAVWRASTTIARAIDPDDPDSDDGAGRDDVRGDAGYNEPRDDAGWTTRNRPKVAR